MILSDKLLQKTLQLTVSSDMYNQAKRGLNGVQPSDRRQVLDAQFQEIEGLHEDVQLSQNDERFMRYNQLAKGLYDSVIGKEMDSQTLQDSYAQIVERSKKAINFDGHDTPEPEFEFER